MLGDTMGMRAGNLVYLEVNHAETVCLCVYEVIDDTPNDPGKTLVAKVGCFFLTRSSTRRTQTSSKFVLKIHVCYLPAGRSVLGKTVPEVLSTARGRLAAGRGPYPRPRAQYGPT